MYTHRKVDSYPAMRCDAIGVRCEIAEPDPHGLAFRSGFRGRVRMVLLLSLSLSLSSRVGRRVARRGCYQMSLFLQATVVFFISSLISAGRTVVAALRLS